MKINFRFCLVLLSFLILKNPQNLANAQIILKNLVQISELSSSNIIFKQYQQEVEQANKDLFLENQGQQNFYTYICKKNDSFISISARCCIRQETLASVNNIENAQSSLEGKQIVLPTHDGLFIAENPESTLEMILQNKYKKNLASYKKYKINERCFYFIPNAKFSPSERSFFLNPGFVSPLEQKIITSSFGKRISPISGKWKNHNGIDLAASYDSNVYACRSGTVLEIKKMDQVYGNCIILLHSNGFTSLYAHLSEILVEENQSLSAGHLIGKVGLTGLTTGPHLHFEIHQNGTAKNPEDYF